VIGHERWRRAIVDQAAGLLEAGRVPALTRHLEGCRACRDEHDRVRRALHAASEGAARLAEPPVDVAALAARVQAEIDRRLEAPRGHPAGVRWVVWPALAAAAAVVIATRAPRDTAAPPAPAELVAISEGALRQMERTVNREQTARYLEDAHNVLVSVAAALPRCERAEEGRRAVGPEARKSRELLARRRLLVDAEAETVASARPVLEDVDRTLADVAALERCAGPAELRAIARRIAEERLLMKIDLMARELQG